MTTDSTLTAGPAPGPAAADRRAWPVRTLTSLRVWARIVLIPVAVIGAALSFDSLYRAAVPVFGDRLAYGFPLLVDALILGASLEYVAGAKVGRPHSGWRLTAHAGIAGTLALNALAAHTPAEVPWHIVAPAVWSVLVELTARQTLGEWKAAHKPPADAIPLRLWLTAFGESRRVWLRMARRLDGEQAAARLEVGQHAAAVEALRLDLPGRRARRTRRILQDQLRVGSLHPADLPAILGWTTSTDSRTSLTPDTALRAALRATLLASGPHDLRAPREITPVGQAADQLPAPAALTAVTAGVANGPATANGTVASVATHGPDSTGLANHVLASVANGLATQNGSVAHGLATGEVGQPDVSAIVANPAVANGGSPDPGGPGGRAGEARKAVAAAGRPRQRQAVAASVDDDVLPQLTRLGPEASTGDRQQDAIALLQADCALTGRQMAERLRDLGWDVANRTGGRILAEATRQLASKVAVGR
jgi:hypothetical protein